MKVQTALSSIVWASTVFAHTIFQRVHVNGVDQGYLKGVRHPTYNGPITDVTSNDIICNGGPNPLVTPYPTEIIDIPAGSPAAIQYDNVLQPNGWDPTNSADPVDPSHKGPVMIYMAKVPSALQTDVTGLGWFKVFEDGYDGTNWGVDRMVAHHGIVNFTVPACIPPGNYFLRAEMRCAQVNIVGGGSTQPSTVALPVSRGMTAWVDGLLTSRTFAFCTKGAYHGTDPLDLRGYVLIAMLLLSGITINIYYPPYYHHQAVHDNIEVKYDDHDEDYNYDEDIDHNVFV
ncbi:hypothetical protein FRB90_010057 [Tulasnella sp. 427]|nr:hypothetical protein FRB90_010057 [Tulasnella sp. 427]